MNRMEAIKDHFIYLKKLYNWCQTHSQDYYPSETKQVLIKAESIALELEGLGVSKEFAYSLFVFGPLLTNELMEQFNEQ